MEKKLIVTVTFLLLSTLVFAQKKTKLYYNLPPSVDSTICDFLRNAKKHINRGTTIYGIIERDSCQSMYSCNYTISIDWQRLSSLSNKSRIKKIISHTNHYLLINGEDIPLVIRGFDDILVNQEYQMSKSGNSSAFSYSVDACAGNFYIVFRLTNQIISVYYPTF